ncbi:MAG TPA: phytoene/squalene synthase family protein [Chthoniobacteraceae bacterium]|jgi:farnesyl-diphosphate farnesyltransferase
MTPGDLCGPLLRSVSRSFYLSIQALPKGLRAPIGLAYLLARASDTIADSAKASPEVRLAHLGAFQKMVGENARDGVASLQHEILCDNPAEQTLIARLLECLDALAALDESARAEIVALLKKITHGQSLDVQRFAQHSDGAVVALETAEQLEEYTYLVAGCVGEFWTRMGFLRLPNYSSLGPEELCGLGVNFGKGLQLVNILRDLPEDLRQGRCYLPSSDLQAAGLTPAQLLSAPDGAKGVFQHWLRRAVQLLDEGRRYIAGVHSGRVRIACFLPWYLGVETLDLLAGISPLESTKRLKVSRSTVRRALFWAPIAAVSDIPLRGGN